MQCMDKALLACGCVYPIWVFQSRLYSQLRGRSHVPLSISARDLITCERYPFKLPQPIRITGLCGVSQSQITQRREIVNIWQRSCARHAVVYLGGTRIFERLKCVSGYQKVSIVPGGRQRSLRTSGLVRVRMAALSQIRWGWAR